MAVMSLKCRLLQLAALCFFWPLAASMHQLPGVIMLDYLSFNKTVGRFPYALIKFDSVFPHADKQLVVAHAYSPNYVEIYRPLLNFC